MVVIEIQTQEDGSSSTSSFDYTDESQAENKYHTILAFAATSQVPYHACALLDKYGTVIKNDWYRHEPTPDEE